MSPILVSTRDVNISARKSGSGMCMRAALMKTPPRMTKTMVPCSTAHSTRRDESRALAGSRGERRMRSSSSRSASNTIEQAGSITISRKAMRIGVSMSGSPSMSGSRARPAIGI